MSYTYTELKNIVDSVQQSLKDMADNSLKDDAESSSLYERENLRIAFKKLNRDTGFLSFIFVIIFILGVVFEILGYSVLSLVLYVICGFILYLIYKKISIDSLDQSNNSLENTYILLYQHNINTKDKIIIAKNLINLTISRYNDGVMTKFLKISYTNIFNITIIMISVSLPFFLDKWSNSNSNLYIIITIFIIIIGYGITILKNAFTLNGDNFPKDKTIEFYKSIQKDVETICELVETNMLTFDN